MCRSMHWSLWRICWMFCCKSCTILHLPVWIYRKSFCRLLWNSKAYVFFLSVSLLWQIVCSHFNHCLFVWCCCTLVPEPEVHVCQPSPCGPYSICNEHNGLAICTCIENYIGSPPACRPECTINSECDLDKACVNHKCVNPCASSICGDQARCQAINHNPICSCPLGFTGDPFVRCIPEESKLMRTLHTFAFGLSALNRLLAFLFALHTHTHKHCCLFFLYYFLYTN